MKKFVLDTNLYVYAFRSTDHAEALKAYFASYTPSTYLSSVVLHELLVGSNTPRKVREIHELIAQPLVRTGRLITPSHGAWQTSGEAIGRMAAKERRDLRSIAKSLVNDYLLAASCREAGATLITNNVSDFEGIVRYLKFEFQAPWPG